MSVALYFLMGKYDAPDKQAQAAQALARAKENKPQTVTVTVVSDWADEKCEKRKQNALRRVAAYARENQIATNKNGRPTGVFYREKHNDYEVKIYAGNRRYRLGFYRTEQEAIAARIDHINRYIK